MQEGFVLWSKITAARSLAIAIPRHLPKLYNMEHREPLPDPIPIPDDDEELLAECRVDTFAAGGPGGQHQNRTESGVRITHHPSGIVFTCREERSQHRNKALALKRLRAELERRNRRPKDRKRTRVPARERRKRLEDKRRRSRLKAKRKPPSSEGDG